jgi:hypothetical protein
LYIAGFFVPEGFAIRGSLSYTIFIGGAVPHSAENDMTYQEIVEQAKKFRVYQVCLMYVPRRIQEAAAPSTPIIITPEVQKAIDSTKEINDMTYQEIVEQAKKFRGMEMSMKQFRFCFGEGEKMMNRLIKDGVMEVSGEYPNNGRPCKKYRVK